MVDSVVEELDMPFTVEGERKPRRLKASKEITIADFLKLVIVETGRSELAEVWLEDEEIALQGDHILAKCVLTEDFKLIHVATRGLIRVFVIFNGKTKEDDFRPNTTMEKIIKWALRAFELEGEPANYQLKHGEEVLPAGEHLGQVADGAKEVRLALVMKIKPQG